MSFRDEPPLDARSAGRADDLERLLRDFYRSEMPQPWPAFIPPPSNGRGCVVAAPDVRANGHALGVFSSLVTTPSDSDSTLEPSWWSRLVPVRSRLVLGLSVALLLFGLALMPGKFQLGAPQGGAELDGGGASAGKNDNNRLIEDENRYHIDKELIQGREGGSVHIRVTPEGP